MLIETNLSYPLCSVLTELGGGIKVLHEMWEQAEDIQGKTCWIQTNLFI